MCPRLRLHYFLSCSKPRGLPFMDHIIWYPIIVDSGQWEALTGDGRTRGNRNQHIYSSYSLSVFHGSNNNPFITIASVWWSLILVILAPGWVLITSRNYLHESSKQHILKFSFKYTTLWILKKKRMQRKGNSAFSERAFGNIQCMRLCLGLSTLSNISKYFLALWMLISVVVEGIKGPT